jgi:hypothetical protein
MRLAVLAERMVAVMADLFMRVSGFWKKTWLSLCGPGRPPCQRDGIC